MEQTCFLGRLTFIEVKEVKELKKLRLK